MFLLTLGVMTLMIFIVLLGKTAVDHGLGLGGLLQLTPYVLPNALQFTLPGALLLAVTGVYGRLASANELVAVKSMGISPMVLVWPAIILSVLVSFSAVWLNDLAVSWGRLGQERVILESMEAIAYGQLRTKGSFEHGNLTVHVQNVQGRTLVEPTLVVKEKGNELATVVSARRAQFAANVDGGQLVLRMEDTDAMGSLDLIAPGVEEYVFPLDELLGARNRSRSPSNYSLAEIGPAKEYENETISKNRQTMSTEAAFAMLTGEFDALGDDAWRPQEQAIRNAENRLTRFHAEPYRRWSSGFSCLAFAVVGVPVAVWLRKGEMLASFFACFAPILIVYYPMFIGTIAGAKKGGLPPQSVWLGNVVLILIGLYLMRREVRH